MSTCCQSGMQCTLQLRPRTLSPACPLARPPIRPHKLACPCARARHCPASALLRPTLAWPWPACRVGMNEVTMEAMRERIIGAVSPYVEIESPDLVEVGCGVGP